MKISLFGAQVFKNVEVDENMRIDYNNRTRNKCIFLVPTTSLVQNPLTNNYMQIFLTKYRQGIAFLVCAFKL